MAKKLRRRADLVFLNSIIDNIPNMIFVKDAKDLTFVGMNKAGEKLLGMKQEQLLGKNDYDFFPKEEADFFTRKDRAVLKSGKMLDIPEETIQTRKQGLRALHTKKVPLRDANGKVRYLLGISEDITDRKNASQKERQAEIEEQNKELERKVEQRTSELHAAVKELESFSYSVSHDLRAPLRAIDGFAKILLDDHRSFLNDEGQRLLSIVSKNALQMSQLIDDLLSFSRVANKDFIKHRVPMMDLVNRISEEMKQSADGARCQVQVSALPDGFGDAPLLRQVWTNLLSNAIKFSRPIAAPQIEIGATMTTDAVTYHIGDNGVGFDMEYADKLFGVFQRLHSPAEFEGTGVGLAIIQRIIIKHGGRAWAVGKPGQGATFYFTLPSR